jgi:hypothetical protein
VTLEADGMQGVKGSNPLSSTTGQVRTVINHQ